MINLALAIVLAPLLFGIINKTKAFFAGRIGYPFFQLYYDLFKLFRKNFVYSNTTSWVFRAGPIIGIVVALVILLFLPKSIFAFNGDILLVAYLFALMRFFTVIAAIDTGSAFEGMGSAREVLYAIFAELALFMSFITLAYMTKNMSLASMLTEISGDHWMNFGPAMVLLSLVLFVIILLENCRIPFDDPNTHLELTMIHEVMVLDHGSFDLGLIEYASSLKLWIWCSILAHIIFPFSSICINVLGIFIIAIFIGIVESTMARFRLVRIPQIILGVFALSIFSFFLVR